MRGKPSRLNHQPPRTGLIPAHAGKTPAHYCSQHQSRAHPRACGENRSGSHVLNADQGSSPRMRGKPWRNDGAESGWGLIPAHAGKTCRRAVPTVFHRAHPRACGENGDDERCNIFMQGSSPRMRGKHATSSEARGAVGLIPAHAGKTVRQATRRSLGPAHPRACGENKIMKTINEAIYGSSPRMRGKLTQPRFIVLIRRLIPAHAGKTTKCAPWKAARPAHPRACGENRQLTCIAHVALGSSPRMRGKRVVNSVSLCGTGLIPAHAGKTSCLIAVEVDTQAHPRACGENEHFHSFETCKLGSSPRMRGKL